ncbi:membrane bound O-acyl transferase family-domain-containing protein [Cyathus striatus]|nr:membrane bound O-acyl transferase family-domain-containing protein [Cyathus striatus]
MTCHSSFPLNSSSKSTMPVNEDVANTAVLSDTGLRPLPPFLPPLTQALFFIGLLSCSRASRVVLFIPIVCISHYVLFYTTKGKDISDMETANSIALTLLKASDALLINDVAKLRLVGQKNDTNELGLVERVKWALKFFYSPRQIGWTHEPRHVIPPHPTESRWKFVRSRIVHCLGYFFLTDILNTYMCYTPAFWRNDISIADGGIGKRVLHSVMMVSLSWAFFNLVYTIMAVVVVAVRLTDASEWPALYGKISDGYTVRRFWGRVWHQSLRRVFTVHGEFVAFRLLGLRKDSFLGNTVNHYVVFALSGLLHAITEYGLFRGKYWSSAPRCRFSFFKLRLSWSSIKLVRCWG